MITGRQLRAARVLAGLTAQEIAARADIPASALDALEAADAAPLIPGQAGLDRARRALEQAGVEFIDEPGGGVRLRPSGFDEGLRPDELTAENDD